MAGLTLQLDGERWREHLRTVAATTPGLVPVIKGNGYGFGLRQLALEAADLGVDTIAVGIPSEVETVRDAFPGDIVILNPWDPASDLARALAVDPRVITTVSRPDDVARLTELDSPPRVLIEALTSMRRHGLRTDDLGWPTVVRDRIGFEGWSIHLPLRADGRYAEVERLARAALAAEPAPLWVSHLPVDEAVALARQLGSADDSPAPVRLRVGTRLWLGDESTRSTTATVLDVHRVERGERAGYRQHRVPGDGWVVVVAGGTSHGVGMEAPTSASTTRQRAVALATGSLEAAGRALSPYTVNGRKRWFLEPPHMQSSQIFLSAKEQPPAVGSEVPVELRLTTATVDEIRWV